MEEMHTGELWQNFVPHDSRATPRSTLPAVQGGYTAVRGAAAAAPVAGREKPPFSSTAPSPRATLKRSAAAAILIKPRREEASLAVTGRRARGAGRGKAAAGNIEKWKGCASSECVSEFGGLAAVCSVAGCLQRSGGCAWQQALQRFHVSESDHPPNGQIHS